MVKQDLLTQSKVIPVLHSALLSLLLIFVFSSQSLGQNQIACNDLVQVSLDDECRAVIRPDMVIEGGPATVNLTHRVKVSGINPTTPYTHPVVIKPGLYTVTITNPTGNTCWGQIRVEDKLAPQVECFCPVGNDDPECALRCTDEAAFLANTLDYPRPIVTEYCSTYTTTTSDEVIPTGNCGAKIIRRTWIFTDIYGNKSIPCTSEYRFDPVTIADVTPPHNSVLLTCGADISMAGVFNFYKAKLYAEYRASYILSGTYATIAAAEAAANRDATADAIRYAWPSVNGVPLTGHVCNILAAKSDTELDACGPACGNSKKIIRVWTILDWCSGTTRTTTQVIKAADEEAPTVVAKDITVSVDPWSCSANFLLPAPDILHDNCSSTVTYTVTGPIGVSIIFDIRSGRYLASGVPKDVNTFTYIAKDCCGNEGTDEITVTVLDLTAPVAVAKQHIIISLTTGGESDGIAKLFASSVDNGSYDSCTPVHLELRREDDPNRDEDGCGYTGNKTYNADGHPDDGSTNPASASYDPDNGAYVKFCCADITNREGPIPFGIVKVWMRVWDDGNMSGEYGDVVDGQSDNYNETWVEVRVEDKLTPQIICPGPVTVDCDDDIHNLDITGRATAYSNCSDLEVEYTDKEYLDNCGVGYIDRTWRIKSRPSVVCLQRIYQVNPFGPFTEDKITWPENITTNCADNAALAKPTWVAGPCDVIGLSLESDTFYFEGNACMKILNKWTIINWCNYDPNDKDSDGYFSHTQVVKVIDEVKPTLGSCADRMFEIDDHSDSDGDGNRCETKNLMLTQTATDQGQCSSDWLKWIVFVDLWGDGTYDYEYSSFLPSTDATFNDTNGNGYKDRYVSPTGQGGEVKITIPEDIVGSMSNHKVTWKVVDGCGNVTSCTQNFMVVDKKKPTPYCLNISSALMQNGKVELWAVDFNLGSFDNCTSKSNLLYTFNEANPVLTKINEIHYFKGAGLNATEAEYNAGNAQKWLPNTKSSGMVFDCGDIPTVDVKMTVWDEKLNFDYCVVTLNLADNQGACGGAQTTTVSGRLITNNGKTIGNAGIVLDNGISEMLSSTVSTANGDYAFPSAVMYYDYNISGEKNDDYLNGVSTLDLVMIQRHILSISKFKDPYNIIAADINNDEKITASDLLELRKLILGIYTALPKNDSWRFINNGQSFADINSPWPFSEKINISNLSHTMTNQNFVGVKVGDVNGSAVANANNETVETRSNVVLMTENTAVEANTIHSAVFSSDIDKVYGLQFTLTLNNADLADVYVGNQKLSDANIAKIADNKYTVSWNDVNAVNGKEILTVNVFSKGNTMVSDVISMNSTVTTAEIYTGENLQTSKLSLRFAGSEDTAEFAVYQNEPNPFNDKTVITFNLPEAGNATLNVFDVTGQVIFTNKGSFGKGMNSFTLTRNDLPSTGVMIYQIESGAYTATKKMIGLE
jgi:Dockerin type I domain/Secretion system C-terminal sorting domain